MFKSSALFCLCILPLFLTAQCDAPKFPSEAKFECNADYRAKDGLVKGYLEWLSDTPLNLCLSEREQLNAFVLVWLSGHPDITVNVKSDAMPFFRTYPDLLFPMLHGMAIYEMDTPSAERNAVDAHVKGLETVLDVVSDKEVLRQPDFKALRKLRRKGRLNEYVAGKI